VFLSDGGTVDNDVTELHGEVLNEKRLCHSALFSCGPRMNENKPWRSSPGCSAHLACRFVNVRLLCVSSLSSLSLFESISYLFLKEKKRRLHRVYVYGVCRAVRLWPTMTITIILYQFWDHDSFSQFFIDFRDKVFILPQLICSYDFIEAKHAFEMSISQLIMFS